MFAGVWPGRCRALTSVYVWMTENDDRNRRQKGMLEMLVYSSGYRLMEYAHCQPLSKSRAPKQSVFFGVDLFFKSDVETTTWRASDQLGFLAPVYYIFVADE